MQNESKPKKSGHRFQPGQSGNPAGKPRGTRHRATQLAQTLMEGGIEDAVNVVLQAAKSGDVQAAKVIIDKLLPAVRERPVTIDLPDVTTATGVSEAQTAVLKALADGEIAPGEATAIAGVIEARRRSIETMELEQRVAALEGKTK